MSGERPVIGAKVEGYCPMGCGATLFIDCGRVTCAYLECPNPCVVGEILGERETEHIVTFDECGFHIQHPLRERINDEMFNCGLYAYCRLLTCPPAGPGRYRAMLIAGNVWRFAPADHARTVA